MKKIYLLMVAFSMTWASVLANNIQLSGVGLSGQNTVSDFSLIGFSVNWENSWRVANNENNWDAAWIFAKFRKKGASQWQHATLNTSGHTAATGATISTPADGKGVFIYRSAAGIGSVDFTGNNLRWNYGVDGVLDSDSVEVNVFACEMVYVTSGAFYLGSNGDETGHFRRGDKDTTYLLSSENPITVGPAASNLTFTGSTFTGTPAGPIPAAYPKGFNAFYCMKYECSEQQYVDFLLNLDATRSNNRNMAAGIVNGTYPNFTAAAPERALGAASFQDMAAYSDWAGLRPMTELEYEKASRGFNIAPQINENAWGNTTVITSTGVVNPGLDNETVTTGNVNHGNAIGRPLRTGIFANTLSNRVSSGGTYYGIMEMSGNVMEPVITVGNAAGRTFTGQHGDGNLDVDGLTDNTQLTAGSTWGYRGGSYSDGVAILKLSDRFLANRGASIGNNSRAANYGIRCVRTAP